MVAACSPKSGGDVKTANEITLGNPDAKVTVVEWASLTCPHCARWNEEVFPEFKKKYIDSGQVRYVFREFLTPPEQVAAAGFLLARCAGKDKYFNVTDAVFHSQNEMFSTGDVRGVLFRIGRSVGMTDDQVQACVQDEKSLAALNERVQKAITTDKVQATPSFDVAGTRLEGEQPLAKFDEVIQAALKK
jgi:protein-disulfide isomerase